MKTLLVVGLLCLSSIQAAADVVYSQPHDSSGTLFQSSGNGNDYDQFVWDDFTLASDRDITDIQWRGGYDPAIPPVYPSGPIQYFDLSIWGTIAGQPDIGAGPLALYEMAPNNETAAGTFGGVSMFDYSVSLTTAPFAPFHATAGTRYWVRIGAFQPGVPGWCLAAGSGGDARHFASFVNYAGGTAYVWRTGDIALTLLGSGGSTTSTTTTTTTTTVTTTTSPSCQTISGAALTVIHVTPPPGDDGLAFKGTLTIVPPVAPVLDPVTYGIEVRLVDGGVLALDTLVPGGSFDPMTKTGWKVNKTATRWTYAGPKTGAPGGITKVLLIDKSAKVPGAITFVVKGKAGSYGVSAQVAADVVLSATGACFEATFPATPPAKPSCVLAKTTLRCK